MVLPPKPTGIPSSVWSRIGRNLHENPNHPVGIISNMIHDHFKSLHCGKIFRSHQLPPNPIVSTVQAFDQLLVPKDHCLRSKSDTYYIDGGRHVLRPHGTSHQGDVLASLRNNPSATGAIWTCDVYRKDEVDRIHFPVFHQTDGVRIFPPTTSEDEIVDDLKSSLEGLMKTMFDKAEIPLKLRWDHTATFPFTNPSIEMEILLGKSTKWIECLGSGRMKTEIDPHGWAFGIGIDRLAMLLFQIDDIRTLWSEDVRFLSQFESGKISKFRPFSKYPPTYRDSSFWMPNWMSEDDISRFQFECMHLAGPYGLESLELVDRFVHPTNATVSHCFRFTYRGIEKTLTADECNEIHNSVVNEYIVSLGGRLR